VNLFNGEERAAQGNGDEKKREGRRMESCRAVDALPFLSFIINYLNFFFLGVEQKQTIGVNWLFW